MSNSPPEQRLDPERLLSDLRADGKEAQYLPDADAIVSHLASAARGGEVICVFSNGGFGNIHSKLLSQLSNR